MVIHHIGYLVKNLNKAILCFEALGYILEEPEVYDPVRLVNICFLTNGGYRIELVCPASKDSPIYTLLKRYKNSPYHICYQHPNMDELVAEWNSSGNILIQPPNPAVAIGGKRVCFFMTPIGMIEVLESL